MIIVRFLLGAGEVDAFPTASVAIARWFPAIQRGRIQSVVWMSSRLGRALAEIPVRIIGFLVIVGGLLWFKIDASKPLDDSTE